MEAVEAVENDLDIIAMSTYKVVSAVRQRMLMFFLCGVRFLALFIVLCVGLIGFSKDSVCADLCPLQCYSFSLLCILYVLCVSQFLTFKDDCYCPLSRKLSTASCHHL